jgi:hypothetical protein
MEWRWMPDGGEVSEAVRCSSTSSTTLGLGSVVQRGLGVGRLLMDSCRAEALSGVMVASTGGLSRSLQRSML